jgi:hypothetical protein
MAKKKKPEPPPEPELYQSAWAEALKIAAGADSQKRFTTPFGAYKSDLQRFGREVLGHLYWPGQDAIGRALMQHHRVTLRSSRKTGKTFEAADLALGMLMTAPSIVVTTAPTGRQVKELMWSKIKAAHARARSKLPGRPGAMSLKLDADWFALGVAVNDPQNILGFHAGVTPPKTDEDELDQVTPDGMVDAMMRARIDHPAHRLFVIFDEGHAVPQGVYDAIEGSLSGDNVYVLMQGNPRMAADANHTFANSFKDGSGWYRIHLAAEEPGDDPVGSDECFHEVPEWLLDKKWVEARRQEWGEESPLFQSDVRGLFSTAALEKQIVPLWVLEGANQYEIYDDGKPESRHIGCDVAGGESDGKDWCIATLWINGVLSCLHRWKSPDTMKTVGVLEGLLEKWAPDGKRIPGSNLHVDGTGIGKGVGDRLRQKGLHCDVVDFGTRARYDWKQITGDMKFRDRKTELYWAVRRAMQEGLCQIPRKYVDVWRQLQWHTHKYVTRSAEGTFIGIAESKDQIRDKYGRSPDEADASVVAWSRSGRKPTFQLASISSPLRVR